MTVIKDLVLKLNIPDKVNSVQMTLHNTKEAGIKLGYLLYE